MAVLALLRRFVPALALLLALGPHAGLLPGARAQSLQPVPPLQARVTDLTGTLDAGWGIRLTPVLKMQSGAPDGRFFQTRPGELNRRARSTPAGDRSRPPHRRSSRI